MRGYEIRRDGELLEIRDGLSFFTDDLIDGRAFAFSVTAVDFDGERSAPASVSVVGGDRGGAVGAGGGRPTPPANLTSRVYSSSAGEVFWDRVSGANLSYEVALDGEVAATTDGTSYFVGDRPGLDGTTVEVVAIGPDGSRSGASSTVLGNGGPSNPDPDQNPGAAAPPAPANARIDVYSGTAAELFWDRVPAGANVAETEIVRDGEVLGTRDGTSFVDPNRTPGRDHRYELVAVDASGARSAVTVVGANDAPSDDESILFDPQALNASLPLLFDVLNGLPVERVQLAGDRLFDAVNRNEADTVGLEDPESFLEEGTQVIVFEYSCVRSGELVFRSIGRGGRVLADDCSLFPGTFDGEFGRPRGLGTTDTADIRGFSVDVDGRRAALSATTSVGTTSELGFGERRTLDVATYESVGPRPGEDLRLDGFRLAFGNETAMSADRTVGRSFEVSGTFTAPWAGAGPVAIETVEPLTSTSPATTYEAGRVVVSDAGGRTLSIDAGNGGRDIYRVSIEPDGVATSVFRRWGGSEGLRCTVFDNGLGSDPACP